MIYAYDGIKITIDVEPEKAIVSQKLILEQYQEEAKNY